MLRGDLSVAGLADVLRDLADRGSTGRLLITRNPAPSAGMARQVSMYLNRGVLYAAEIDDSGTDSDAGPDDRLATRLLVHGILTLDALRDARQAQDELVDWSLGELLVQLGHVPAEVVQEIAELELVDAVSTAAGWAGGNWRLRRGDRARQLLTRSLELTDLLDKVDQQLRAWVALESQGFGVLYAPRHRSQPADAATAEGWVPVDELDTAELDTDRAALLREIDAQTPIFALASRCGLTALETATIAAGLAAGGHLDRPEPELTPEDSADPLLRVSASVRAALTGDGVEPEPGLEPLVQLIPSDRPAAPVEDLDPETAERRLRLRAQAARELVDAQLEVTQLPETAAWQWDAVLADPADGPDAGADAGTAPEPEPAAVAAVHLDESTTLDLIDRLDLLAVPPASTPDDPAMGAGAPIRADGADGPIDTDAMVGADGHDAAADDAPRDLADAEPAQDPADMASLLRELTSLGLEDDAPPPPRPVVPAQSVAPTPAPQRKRKGLLRRAQ